MTLEFQTQYAVVDDQLIGYIRNELMKLYHLFKKISRAEVVLKEDKSIIPSENKMCEIKLSVFGSNMVAHSRSENFTKSAKKVLKELKRLVSQELEKKNELPEIITSTVRVK